MTSHHTKNCRSKTRWTSAGSLKSSWRCLGGLNADRLMILDSVWGKEAGLLSRHCRLVAVENGSIMVRASSPAAAQELVMRSRQIIKGLNKYFNRPWIRNVKTSVRG